MNPKGPKTCLDKWSGVGGTAPPYATWRLTLLLHPANFFPARESGDAKPYRCRPFNLIHTNPENAATLADKIAAMQKSLKDIELALRQTGAQASFAENNGDYTGQGSE